MKNTNDTNCCTTESVDNSNQNCCTSDADVSRSGENNFAKSNPVYLNSMFGSTDLTPLWLADMDFKVSEPITKEIQRLAERGNYAYEFKSQEVFKSITNWNLKRNKLELNPKSFVQVPGVLTGIALLIRELTLEGDGVLIQTPVYHQFFNLIKTAGRKIVENPLKEVNGHYQMDFKDLEHKLETEQVKVIVLCNPHNPVGRVWTKEELEQLVNLANTYKTTIVSDEIHSDIIYAPSKFSSISSVAGEKHVAVLGSPAKTFGMHSISNGYLYIPDEALHKQIKVTVSSMYLDHGNIFSTNATLAAYDKSEDWLNGLIDYLEKTIDWIRLFMKDIPGIKMYTPEGTYQIWLDFSGLGLSDDELKKVVVEKAKLALTPGAWFGSGHEQYMRVNIAAPLSEIQSAFNRLKSAID